MATATETAAAEPKEEKTIVTKTGPKSFPVKRKTPAPKPAPAPKKTAAAAEPKTETETAAPKKSDGMGAGGIVACVVAGVVVGIGGLLAALHFTK